MTLRFNRGDIVNTAAMARPAAFVIVSVDPTRPKNAYNGKNLVNGQTYRLSDDHLGVKIGTATPEFIDGTSTNNPTVSVESERGRQHAEMMARFATGMEKARWEVLAKAKPGDWINIKLRAKPERVQFQMVNMKGEKYVFSATNGNGTGYKYPLSVIVVANVAKRPDAEIIEDLRGVEAGLSPENLTGDGEFSRAYVRSQMAKLSQQKRDLIAELGRTPTTKELFGF